MNSSQMEPGESVIFQIVLQAYPPPGTLGSSLCMYHLEIWNAAGNSSTGNSPYTTIPQILGPTSISTNTTTHYTPARIIQHTGHIQIQRDYYHLCHQSTELQPTADQHTMQKKLIALPRDCTLSWLTGTATTKDIHSIKSRINQLIATQTSQPNTLVHIVSILNVTRYATQVNRHSINNLIDAVRTTSQDINNLYNLTTSLAASINSNQMILHIRSVFANL